MSYVPVMLNVSDRKILIIGGGEAAAKKTRNLIAHSERILVVASEFSREFSRLGVEKVTARLKSPDEVEKYLDDRSIVIIATDDVRLNEGLERICREKDILYNRVDNNESAFIFPAVSESDGVLITVSTQGRSPSFARFLRDVLQKEAGRYTKALPVIERVRSKVEIPNVKLRAEFFRTLLSDKEFWDLINRKSPDEAFNFGLEKARSFLKKRTRLTDRQEFS